MSANPRRPSGSRLRRGNTTAQTRATFAPLGNTDRHDSSTVDVALAAEAIAAVVEVRNPVAAVVRGADLEGAGAEGRVEAHVSFAAMRARGVGSSGGVNCG